MKIEFDVLRKSRLLAIKELDGLTLEQMHTIPTGFKNNIAWNFTHLLVTQQLLCYKLSGLKCLISDEMIENFQKGSSPSYQVSIEEFEKNKELFIQLPIELEKDYNAGIIIESNNNSLYKALLKIRKANIILMANNARKLVEEKLEGTDMFIVELSVSSNSKIVVEIDGMSGVAIADCVEVSRQIESNLDRDQEDFELQVSSAGIDKPLRDKRQFEKNIGREVKIVLQDSAELKGELLEVGDSLKLKLPASKKKKLPEREEIIAWENIRETKILISFK